MTQKTDIDDTLRKLKVITTKGTNLCYVIHEILGDAGHKQNVQTIVPELAALRSQIARSHGVILNFYAEQKK